MARKKKSDSGVDRIYDVDGNLFSPSPVFRLRRYSPSGFLSRKGLRNYGKNGFQKQMAKLRRAFIKGLLR